MEFGARKTNKLSDERNRVEINPPMQGNVMFKEQPVDLHINGKFKGSLEFHGTLTAGEQSELEANISGDNIIILGKVKGDIKAHKFLVLMPTAVVYGNISAPKINLVEGAVFQGNCQMAEDMLDIGEVSRYLEIDRKEIEVLADAGKIPGKREDDGWKFERSQIDHWASSGKIS